MAPNRSYSFINELSKNNEDSRIKVRVSRLWDVVSYRNNNSLAAVDMVLLDEEGDYVHATIGSNLWNRFRDKITEGSVYNIANFTVEDNKKMWRVVSDNKLMLSFSFKTQVKAVKHDISKIPRHRFDFVHYHNLEHRRNIDDVLSDVVGVLVNEVGEGDVIAIDIEDRGCQRVRIKLWNQCIVDYNLQRKEIGETSKPISVVVSSAKVRGKTAETLRLETSLSSKVYLNLDLPEIAELKDLWSEKQEGFVIGKQSFQKRGVLDYVDMVNNKKDILSILAYCSSSSRKPMLCYCVAEVTGINSAKDWNYPSCRACNKKPDIRRSDFYCRGCDKAFTDPKLLFRVELSVKDDSGTTIITILNDEVQRFVEQDADSLYDAHTKEEESSEEFIDTVPRLLRTTFEEKIFIFKIKINDFNFNVKNRQTFTATNVFEESQLETHSASEKSVPAQHAQATSTDAREVSRNEEFTPASTTEDDDDTPISALLTKRPTRNVTQKRRLILTDETDSGSSDYEEGEYISSSSKRAKMNSKALD